MVKSRAGKWFLLATLSGLGCGERSDSWDATFQPRASVGLNSAVAVVDEGLHRVAFLDSPSDLALRARYVRVGRDVATAEPSLDGNRLFVISRGVQPRRDPEDEKPRFMAIDVSGDAPTVLRQDELEQALSGLALDPQGDWAVIYDGGGNGTAFVTNPNELLLISLSDAQAAPISKTLRSEGGKPQRVHFTRPLNMPDGGSRRFLIVEREHDLALVDLTDPSNSEITVGSPSNANQRESSPAEVVYYEGDGLNNAQFAIRFSDDSSVGVLELHPPEDGDQLFSISYNLVDVGGVPSAVAFVRTDAGVRLSAVVPSALAAVLVDTVTSDTTVVDLDFPFTGLELVTNALATAPDSGDFALLYSSSSTAIGFWALGKTSGQPYRSLETNDIGVAVSQVLDVPGQDFQHYKLLKSTSGAQFFVLDLDLRQSFPMDGLTSLELRVAPDGHRVWAYQPQGTNLARVSLEDLHPVSLSTERQITGLFDISRGDGLGRTAVALHAQGGLGATVFDALEPDTAHSRFYSGFEFGGLR